MRVSTINLQQTLLEGKKYITGDMILCKNSKESSIDKQLELIWEFSKMADVKSVYKNQLYFYLQ